MNKSNYITDMIKVGVHIGHKKSNYHPKVKQYIAEKKDDVYIFDLNLTKQKLEEVLIFVKDIFENNKTIMFVGTKVQLKEIIKVAAEKLNMPYVNTKWPGGFFTNFGIIKKRIEYFLKLEKDVKEGKYKGLIKKQQLKIDKELEKLRAKFSGVREITKLPDVVFVADINKNKITVREAKVKGIKVIGIVNTNVNPELVDYPIPANNDSIGSVQYILNKIIEQQSKFN